MYLINSSLRHTNEVGNFIEPHIEYCMTLYDGPKEKALLYEKELRLTLQHMIHCSYIISNGHTQLQENGWIPIPLASPDFQRKHPMIVRHANSRTGGLGFTRCLDLLCETGILRKKAHNTQASKCTQFRLTSSFLSGLRSSMFTHVDNRADYLKLSRLYDITRPGMKSYGAATKMEGLIQIGILRGMRKPKHDLTKLNEQCRQKKEVHHRYKQVFSTLKPIQFDLNKVLDYIVYLERKAAPLLYSSRILKKREQRKLNAYARRKFQVEYNLTMILERGIEVIKGSLTDRKFIVQYMPCYCPTPIGGRMFELHGGMQNMPSALKAKCLIGQNWDIESSQLSILKELCTENKLYFDSEKYEDVQHIADHLEIKKKAGKVVLYGTIFNAGDIRISPFSSIYSYLKYHLGRSAKAKRTMTKWQDYSTDLTAAILQLAYIFANSPSAKSRYGYTYTNAVGLKFLVRPEDFTAKGNMSKRCLRQLLAHMIQGIETEYVLKTVEAGAKVCSLEHDGFVGTLGKRIKFRNLKLIKKWENHA